MLRKFCLISIFTFLEDERKKLNLVITQLLILGCFASWIGSWAMYGLGLVVEHVENGGTAPSSSGYTSAGIRTEDGGVKMTATNYWICPKCKNRNPFSKVECKECGTIRQ